MALEVDMWRAINDVRDSVDDELLEFGGEVDLGHKRQLELLVRLVLCPDEIVEVVLADVEDAWAGSLEQINVYCQQRGWYGERKKKKIKTKKWAFSLFR